MRIAHPVQSHQYSGLRKPLFDKAVGRCDGKRADHHRHSFMMHAGGHLVQGFAVQLPVRQSAGLAPLFNVAQLPGTLFREKNPPNIPRPPLKYPQAGVPSTNGKFFFLDPLGIRFPNAVFLLIQFFVQDKVFDDGGQFRQSNGNRKRGEMKKAGATCFVSGYRTKFANCSFILLRRSTKTSIIWSLILD